MNYINIKYCAQIQHLNLCLIQVDTYELLQRLLPIEAWCDSWALVNWILVDIIDDSHTWLEVALTRDEPTSDMTSLFRDVTYKINRRVIRLIRKRKARDIDEWIDFVKEVGVLVCPSVMNDDFIQQLDIPRLVIPHNVGSSTDSFITGLYAWAKFLSQTRLKAYYDDVEGIGVMSNCTIEQGESIHELSGQLFLVGSDVARTPYPDGMRWSFFGDNYMSGPVSMINCSCSKHRNVNMRPSPDWKENETKMQVVCEWSVEAGVKLYAAYNSNIDEMLQSRGISCRICKK